MRSRASHWFIGSMCWLVFLLSLALIVASIELITEGHWKFIVGLVVAPALWFLIAILIETEWPFEDDDRSGTEGNGK